MKHKFVDPMARAKARGVRIDGWLVPTEGEPLEWRRRPENVGKFAGE